MLKKLLKRPSTYLIIILASLVLCLGTRYLVFWQLKNILVTAFRESKSEGLSVQFESLEVNFWKGSFTLQGISVTALPRTPSDSTFLAATVPELHAEGISVTNLLLKRQLLVSSVVIKGPSFYHRDNFKFRGKKLKTGFLRGFQINELQLDSCAFEWKGRITSQSKFGLKMNEIQAAMGGDSIIWSVSRIQAKDIHMDLAAQFYSISLEQLTYDGRLKHLFLDSLSMAPSLGRMEFAKKSIHQIDQISFYAPSVRVAAPGLGDGLSFSARNIALAFRLEVFRDRRYPIAQRIPTILPAEFLRRLPFAVHIDSINLLKSYASYEERPADGDTSGKLYFDDLQASIHNISTDSVGETRMQVDARFMGDGPLHGVFTFPLQNSRACTVNGELSHFSMAKINDMLMAVGNARIESGHLAVMKFDFKYDHQQSHGTLELRYTDLQILRLRNDKGKTVKNFATFLVNAMIKNDMTKDDPKARRTGNIKWKRDPQKGILNYWWKSVLSGIKAVLGL